MEVFSAVRNVGALTQLLRFSLQIEIQNGLIVRGKEDLLGKENVLEGKAGVMREELFPIWEQKHCKMWELMRSNTSALL